MGVQPSLKAFGYFALHKYFLARSFAHMLLLRFLKSATPHFEYPYVMSRDTAGEVSFSVLLSFC